MSLSRRRLSELRPGPWQQTQLGLARGRQLHRRRRRQRADRVRRACRRRAHAGRADAGGARAGRPRAGLRLARARPAAACAQRLPQSVHLVDGARGVDRDAALPRRARSRGGRAAALAWRRPAALALAFVYCQARMLQAARASPPGASLCPCRCCSPRGSPRAAALSSPAAPWHGGRHAGALLGFGALVLVRVLRLARLSASPGRTRRARAQTRARSGGPRAAARRNGGAAGASLRLRWAQCRALRRPWSPRWPGMAAALAGAYLKFTLITRAGYNQGFALAHLPVRGARAE